MPLFAIETYGELNPHLSEEWLLTNGLGGFACGTVLGCNTRRYHGLLCAATLPPVGRMMLLSRVGEVMVVDGKTDHTLEFSVNQFSQTFHPRGEQYLQRFELFDGYAQWVYNVEGVGIIKKVQLGWMQNAAAIRYEIAPNGRHVELRLLPFVRMLDFHALRRGKTTFAESHDDRAATVGTPQATLHLRADVGRFEAKADWWFGHTYAVEAERGLDDSEDLYCPGQFVVDSSRNTSITLFASDRQEQAFDFDRELERRCSVVAGYGKRAKGSQTIERLVHAANDFIVYRKSPDGKDGTSIIAGYPWFSDWGRDTMISLPGLLLATRRFEQARQVLGVFAQYVDQGMIPNVFDDYNNNPHYNTVDASLWFIHAAFLYARESGDQATFEKILRPACQAIVDGYTRGTRYNIKVDPADDLVSQGDANTQLTWMDAKCDGITFTPRQGKAVEINALWYHALKLLGDDARAERVAESFRKAFWISPFRGLADVVDGNRRDCSIRPNQIFAVSLPNSPLLPEQQSVVVEVVRRELLTPYGLRTLAKSEVNYQGRYFGPPKQRDAAYHNGTVWAWPIGAFLDAYLKVNGHSEDSLAQAQRWLTPLIDSMRRGCVGQIAEIFEGDEPHRPVGCFAQAWSVAEVLRLAVEIGL